MVYESATEKNQYIHDKLKEKDIKGFKRGELKIFMTQLAEETDSSFHTVKNIYYSKVKEELKNDESVDTKNINFTENKDNDAMELNETKTLSSNNKVDVAKDERENLLDTYIINNKEVRLVSNNGKKYYVGKDVFNSLGMDRSSPFIKNALKPDSKEYIQVKSKYGYVSTLVIETSHLLSFLESIVSSHTSPLIKENALNFLIHFEENGYEVNFYNDKINEPRQEKKLEENENVENMVEKKSEKINTTNESTKPSTITTKERTVQEMNHEISYAKTATIIEQPKEIYSTPLEAQVKKKETAINKSPVDTYAPTNYSDIKLLSEIRYKVNDWVDVEVIRIKDYGVLTETLNELRTPGLIHIRQVKNEFVSDLTMYFEVGDKVRAQIRQYNATENNLSLSTKNTTLPLKSTHSYSGPAEHFEEPIQNSLQEQLSKVKDKIVYGESHKVNSETTNSSFKSKLDDRQANENKTSGVPSEHSITMPQLKIEGNREIEFLIQHLNKTVGVISPAARSLMISTLTETGITPFTLAMMDVIPNFTADLGLIIIKEIQNKVREYL